MVKQIVVMKTLRGYSEKILRTHLWVAAIAYQRIAKIKKDTNGRYSFTEVATLIRGENSTQRTLTGKV